MTGRTLTIGGRSYPLVLPTRRDPRVHVAAVTLSVHVLGQTGLDFRLSVPQILAAILTCAAIEMAIAFHQSRAVVWPSSALLTGSGVALILRVVGTPAGDHWTFHAWYVYAGVAGFALLTKYVIRRRGGHIFNPSNIGLVVAFVVLGTTRVEPLDFWWAPLNAWLIAAYLAIVGGGLLITRRLRLLALSATFWVAFAAGQGVLAAAGHCVTASWSFTPVCGADYWRIIVTSPEVMIFVFYMVTDPKTVPTGRVGRVVFGLLVAIASTLIMAPQADEFGAKVGLLAGLAVMCAIRPLVERFLPEPRSAADDVRAFVSRLVAGPAGAAAPRAAARVGVAGVAAIGVALAIVAAGTPARGVVVPDAVELLDRPPGAIDPATLPSITVGQDVIDFDHELGGPGMAAVAVTLSQNLELENRALLERDEALLHAVDHGDRLDEMTARLREAAATGATTIAHYRFDSMEVSLLVPFGQQTGLSLGLASRGSVTRETYDAAGALQSSTTTPFDLVFAMRRATGARWLNVAVLPAGPG